jgi:small subunit ribosomal protein S8
MMTDPVADLLTRIRNANLAGTKDLTLPASKLKIQLCRILQEEGYIESFRLQEQAPQGAIRVALRYGPGGERVLSGIQRVSRPGRRVYAGKGEIPRVMNGLGIAIVSTSKGILTDRQARQAGVGGEVLCQVW